MFAAVKLKNTLTFLMSFCFLMLLLLFPSAAAEGITGGLGYAFEILVPSLFPYMVLSSFIMRTRAERVIGKAAAPITRAVFNLPSGCASGIILSLVGGFPVGAKCVQLLYAKGVITSQQAERMMLFCVCSGPAFLITAVGAVMLRNPGAGIVLYASQAASCIIIGAILGIISRRKSDSCNEKKNSISVQSQEDSIITSLIQASTDGAYSIISMTALVLIFSLFVNILGSSGFTDAFSSGLSFFGVSPRTAKTVLPIILEVTGACKAVCDSSMPLWYFSLAAGFGGLCVHFQIFDILKDVPIRRGRYLIFRVINAVLSSLIAYIVCRFYSPTAETFTVFGGQQAELSATTAAGSAVLVIMSVVFALTMRRKNFPRNKSGIR